MWNDPSTFSQKHFEANNRSLIIYEKLRVILSLFVISCVCLLSFLYCFNILCTRWLDQNIENFKKASHGKRIAYRRKLMPFFVSIDGNDWLVTWINVPLYLSIVLFFVDKDWYSSRGRNDCKRTYKILFVSL